MSLDGARPQFIALDEIRGEILDVIVVDEVAPLPDLVVELSIDTRPAVEQIERLVGQMNSSLGQTGYREDALVRLLRACDAVQVPIRGRSGVAWCDFGAVQIDMAAVARALWHDGTDDMQDYDNNPEGCWATDARYDPEDPDAEACDLPSVDALGLCAKHRAEKVTDG